MSRSMPVHVQEKVPHDAGDMLKTGKRLSPVAESGANLSLQHIEHKILVCGIGT